MLKNRWKLAIPVDLKSRRTFLAGAIVAVALIVATALSVLLPGRRNDGAPDLPVPPEIAAMDLKTARMRVASLTKEIERLEQKESRLFPTGNAILIDSAANQIYLVKGSRIVVQDKCSTGSGLELTDTHGQRTWTFDTPRGYFRALSKVANPVWYRPDWAFIEEGEPIPKDRASRAVADVLGDYAIAFGDGYFIHGTLYTRMLGTSVTHGCVRVDDDTLKKIYQAAQPGTPIWIF